MIKKKISIEKAFELMFAGEEVISTTRDSCGFCKRKIENKKFLYYVNPDDPIDDFQSSHITVDDLLECDFFIEKEAVSTSFSFKSDDISMNQNIDQLYFSYSKNNNLLSDIFPVRSNPMVEVTVKEFSDKDISFPEAMDRLMKGESIVSKLISSGDCDEYKLIDNRICFKDSFGNFHPSDLLVSECLNYKEWRGKCCDVIVYNIKANELHTCYPVQGGKFNVDFEITIKEVEE